MPGENCCVLSCGGSRRQKNIGIFKIPSVKRAEFRKNWIRAITKSRVMDSNFQTQIENQCA